MIFVDTNVFMYAVGRDHPLREQARSFFADNFERKSQLVTSSEVLQELMHAYLPVKRISTLDAALKLAESATGAVWPVEREDIVFARLLLDRYPELGARGLIRSPDHLLGPFHPGLIDFRARSGTSGCHQRVRQVCLGGNEIEPGLDHTAPN